MSDYDNHATANSTNVSSLTISNFTTSGSNRGLVAGADLGNESPSRTTSGVTYNSVSLTADQATTFFGGEQSLSSWKMTAEAASGANDVVFTFSGSCELAIVSVYSATSVDVTDQVRNSAKSAADASGSSSSHNITTVSGDLVVDFLSTDSNPTVGGGQTERFDVVIGVHHCAGSTESASGTSTTMSWTFSNDEYAHIALSFKTQSSSTYNESVTITGNATVTEDGPVSMFPSVAFSADGTVGPSTNIVMGSLVTLTANSTVSDSEMLLIEMIASLSAVSSLSTSEIYIANGSVSVSANAATALSAVLNAVGNLTLAGNATVTPTSLAEMLETLSLAGHSSMALTNVLQGVLEEVLSLTAAASLTASSQHAMAQSLSLAAQATITTQATQFMSGLIALGVDATTTQVAGIAVTKSLTLATAASFATSPFITMAGVGNVGILVAQNLLTNGLSGESLKFNTLTNETLTS